MTPASPQGIIHSLTNDAYHNADPYRGFLSSTQLKYLAQSPKTFRYMLDHPEPSTTAMQFGSLFHDLMTHCAGADSLYACVSSFTESIAVFEPPVNSKTGQPYGASTKTYISAYEGFLSKNEGKVVATPSESALATDMATSLLTLSGPVSRKIKAILKKGTPEVSIFHTYDDGLKVKCRPDLLILEGIHAGIYDYKTTADNDLSSEAISRIVLRYGYHISAAHYQKTVHEVTGKWLDFFLILVSKQPPHDCVIVSLKDWAYYYDTEWDMVTPGPAVVEYTELINLLIKCQSSGKWPGPEAHRVDPKEPVLRLEVPKYYSNRFAE